MSKLAHLLSSSLILVAWNLFGLVYCERLHEQIYSTIEGSAACFRRLNGTHQVGCASPEKGSVGVVQIISSINDGQWIIQNGTRAPYVAVVNTVLFNDVIDMFISNPDNVAGVLIYDDPKFRPARFSEETRCPNEYNSGPGSQCSSSTSGGLVWNEGGTGLLRRDIPFPIFFLPQSRYVEITKISDCYNRFNLDKDNHKCAPLCSLQLTSFMFAAVNSELCLRRSASTAFLTPTKVCDTLTDNNVYSSLFPLNTQTNADYLMVTARIDSASLFDNLSPGAASAAVGIVSLITTAVTLSKMIPMSEFNLYNTNVIWTLLNGEAFDYIGSQRIAYDLSNGAWPPHAPLPPSSIKLHIEIGQLGGSLSNLTDAWNMHVFAPYTSGNVPVAVTDFMEELSTPPANMTVLPHFQTNLPPSSLHSFRRILKNVTESGSLAELLIVDHTENSFTNKFYHSALDTAEYIGFNYKNISVDSNGTFISTEDLIVNGTMKDTDMQVKIAKLSTGLAMALYQKVVGKTYDGQIKASAHMVDELLSCLLLTQSCRLMSVAGASAAADAGPVPMYVSVSSWPGPAALVAHLLVLLTGLPVSDLTTQKQCHQQQSDKYSYYWMNGWNYKGVCIQTTMNYTQAISPAFTISDYDLSSGEYSTWTESVWHAMSVRVFVRAGGGGATAAAIAGAVLTIFTALLLYWLKKHAHVLFEQPPLENTSQLSGSATTGILRSVNC